MNQITIIDPRDVDREGFKHRLQGKDVRDCVLILKTDATPDIAMLVRQPVFNTIVEHVVKGDNIALNIDCSRVGTPFVSSGGNNFDAWRSGEGRKDRPSQHGSSSSKIQEGRFPANLILMHEPECVYTGKKKVKGHHHCVLANKNSSRDGISYSIGKPYSEVTGYTQKDGAEEVDNWECSSVCPVGVLDAQSGVLKSGAHPLTKMKAFTRVSKGTIYGDLGSYSDRIQRPYESNSGGASRFFKQVTSREELDQYFRDLLDKMP